MPVLLSSRLIAARIVARRVHGVHDTLATVPVPHPAACLPRRLVDDVKAVAGGTIVRTGAAAEAAERHQLPGELVTAVLQTWPAARSDRTGPSGPGPTCPTRSDSTVHSSNNRRPFSVTNRASKRSSSTGTSSTSEPRVASGASPRLVQKQWSIVFTAGDGHHGGVGAALPKEGVLVVPVEHVV